MSTAAARLTPYDLLALPDDGKVYERIHRADGGFDFLRENETLTDESVLPGFSVPVADLFRRPSPKPA